jgi:hypothetical protein
MVTILGGLAEFERELIKARTDDGRWRAMANGKRFGRRPKLTAHQIAEAQRRRDAGEPLTEIARSYNVSHSTICRSLSLGSWRQPPMLDADEKDIAPTDTRHKARNWHYLSAFEASSDAELSHAGYQADPTWSCLNRRYLVAETGARRSSP